MSERETEINREREKGWGMRERKSIHGGGRRKSIQTVGGGGGGE